MTQNKSIFQQSYNISGLSLPAVMADSDQKQHIPAQLLSSDKIITGSGMHTWLEDKENKKKVKPLS